MRIVMRFRISRLFLFGNEWIRRVVMPARVLAPVVVEVLFSGAQSSKGPRKALLVALSTRKRGSWLAEMPVDLQA